MPMLHSNIVPIGSVGQSDATVHEGAQRWPIGVVAHTQPLAVGAHALVQSAAVEHTRGPDIPPSPGGGIVPPSPGGGIIPPSAGGGIVPPSVGGGIIPPSRGIIPPSPGVMPPSRGVVPPSPCAGAQTPERHSKMVPAPLGGQSDATVQVGEQRWPIGVVVHVHPRAMGEHAPTQSMGVVHARGPDPASPGGGGFPLSTRGVTPVSDGGGAGASSAVSVVTSVVASVESVDVSSVALASAAASTPSLGLDVHAQSATHPTTMQKNARRDGPAP